MPSIGHTPRTRFACARPFAGRKGRAARPPLWIPAFAGMTGWLAECPGAPVGMTGLVREQRAYGAALVDAGYGFAD